MTLRLVPAPAQPPPALRQLVVCNTNATTTLACAWRSLPGLMALLLDNVELEEQHPVCPPASLRSLWLINTLLTAPSLMNLHALTALEHCDMPLNALPVLARSFPTLREAHLCGFAAGSIMQHSVENIALSRVAQLRQLHIHVPQQPQAAPAELMRLAAALQRAVPQACVEFHNA